jgi:hypothetical protein
MTLRRVPIALRIDAQDEFLGAYRYVAGRRSSRHDERIDIVAWRLQCTIFPEIPLNHFQVAGDSFRMQN